LNEGISQKIDSSEFALMFGRSFNGFKDFSDILVGISNGQTSEEVKRAWKSSKKLFYQKLMLEF
jgi:hypothetical protein